MLVNQHFRKSFCKYGEDDCKQLDVCLSNSSLVMYKNQLILQELSVLWKPIPSQCRSHIRLTQIKVQNGSEHCRTWNISPGEKSCAWLSLRRDGGTLSDDLRTLRPSALVAGAAAGRQLRRLRRRRRGQRARARAAAGNRARLGEGESCPRT